jgi:hypothetical protein
MSGISEKPGRWLSSEPTTFKQPTDDRAAAGSPAKAPKPIAAPAASTDDVRQSVFLSSPTLKTHPRQALNHFAREKLEQAKGKLPK